jgi:glycogen operon protein
VVYNHTAEGGVDGPTYSFRGIDNLSYYALNERKPGEYWNYTGCGNSVNLNQPRVLQLVMDSLRYLVTKIGVDGFRFDLATTLGRGKDSRFSPHHPFFSCLKQDPILSRVQLIAEPWDIGMGGYQVGHFPHDWFEWNDKFRDVIRIFWRGDSGIAPDFARRMHGSGDLFTGRGRSPYASINFISAHDGFTLRDVVSYEHKHNQANKEDNRDGHSHNYSANYGVEGPSTDPKINQLRLQQSKNILASLLLAQGTPMLLAGDEFGNSQQGNNNAYCQDNEISWLDWSALEEHQELIEFCQFLIKLRSRHPLINRPHLSHGLTVSMRTGLTDISWLTTSGKLMTDNDWQNNNLYCFAMMLAATHNFETTDSSDSICSLDDAILLIFNSGTHPTGFTFPEREGYWKLEFNTAESLKIIKKQQLIETKSIDIAPRSCVMCSYVYKSD